jgi:hypothetical protein
VNRNVPRGAFGLHCILEQEPLKALRVFGLTYCFGLDCVLLKGIFAKKFGTPDALTGEYSAGEEIL